MLDRDEVLEYIRKSKPSDLLQILDAAADATADYLGFAQGVESDRHEVLLQLEHDEKEIENAKLIRCF